MPKEVTGSDGINWSCAQAYAGLAEGEAAERAEGDAGRVEVVCTPSGGAKTVRLELASGWEESVGDEELVREIESRRET